MPNNGAGCAVGLNGNVDVVDVLAPKPVIDFPNNPPGIVFVDGVAPNVLVWPKP